MNASLRWRTLGELDAGDLERWTELGLHAGPHPNPFAMPQFVRPAARWLTPTQPPRIAWIERGGAGARRLIGVGAFTFQRPDLFVPLPHLRDYRTPHTFRSGLLCAAGEADAAINALFASARSGPRWHALDVRNLPLDGDGVATMQALAEARGGRWFERHRFERPVLRLREDGAVHSPRHAEAKDLRRRRRRLEEQGALSFRLLHGERADPGAIETHLALEHAGWKGERGSSMLSSRTQTAFFREMMEAFAGIGAAVFMETRLDDRAIASSSNLVLGDTLNGFKIGWDPAYAACSPGRLNEAALFEALPARLPGTRLFDSQAQAQSYLASALPDRLPLVTGTLAPDRRSAWAMRGARLLRPLAYRFDPDE